MPFEDYLAANWLMMRRNWLWKGVLKYLAIVGTIVFAMNLSTSIIDHKLSPIRIFADAATGLIIASAALAATSLWWLWCIPRSAKKAFAELQMDGLPTSYSFDEKGLSVSNKLGSSNLEWKHITNWCENSRLVLLFRTRLSFFCIPKTQIDADTLDALRQELKSASVPTR